MSARNFLYGELHNLFQVMRVLRLKLYALFEEHDVNSSLVT
jgi:hypothetical protein